jgi:hypothetical protein
MPFSALSPDGPVTLLGADPLTIERMRDRNRREKLYTAKCCGAPLVIRTVQGKIPHFVHATTPSFCEGDKHVSPEHLRLQAAVAQAVAGTGWTCETEAIEKDPTSRRPIWRADVLATRSKARVAFEIQLSNPDWTAMLGRQQRYRASGVRGLWFVKTRKGFPAKQELPVFVVETDDDGDWVALARRWDDPYIWSDTDDGDYADLVRFIQMALAGHLKWAPLQSSLDTMLRAEVLYEEHGKCGSCGRTVADPIGVEAKVLGNREYPAFFWHRLMPPRIRTYWYSHILNGVWHSAASHTNVTFATKDCLCTWCGGALDRKPSGYRRYRLAASIPLRGLPRAAFGTIEWDWIHRWALVSSNVAGHRNR